MIPVTMGWYYRLKRKSIQRPEHQKIILHFFICLETASKMSHLSHLKHTLLEAPPMSGIIMELHYDRVLREDFQGLHSAWFGGRNAVLLDTKCSSISSTRVFCEW